MAEYAIWIEEWLDRLFAYGPLWVYLALFAACFIENITPPFPGDSFILAAGGLAAVERLDPFVSGAIAVVGGMLSIMVWYWLGRYRGREFFLRKNYKLFSAEDIHAADRLFNRWGPLILVASRFVVGFRVVIALTAGMGRVPLVTMIIFSAVSYIGFVAVVMYLGYVFVENLDVVEYYFRTYNYIAWPIAISLVILLVVYKVRRIRRKQK
jgi:membrane protein DedA with SNARE-associated domain